MNKFFICLLCLVFVVVFLVLAFRGRVVNGLLDYQKTYTTAVGEPFELSNTTSRYALTQAIAESHTFFLNQAQAQFAAPDVVSYHEKFISIFTPGISMLAVPFYLLGKQVGMPQIFAFLFTIVMAIINLFLVARLSRKFGAGFYSSLAAGLTFVFATNALPYSQTLTQHHTSVAIILSSILLVFNKPGLLRNVAIGALYGLGLLVDIPNGILLLPVLLLSAFQSFSANKEAGKITFKIKLGVVGILLGLLPLIAVFGFYNLQTTGSVTLLAQSVGRTNAFSDQLPVQNKVVVAKSSESSALESKSILPFNTRNQLGGMYTLLLSDERSWIYYSPVVLLGILGLFLAYRHNENKSLFAVAGAIVLLDIVLYSSFGDPWGGWAFGPRYLLPAAAILVSGIGVVIEIFRRKILFWAVFLPVMVYSVGVNTIGVMTTNAIPPKVEAVNLPNPIPYTYQYNLNLINAGFTSSLFYNYFLSDKITIPAYLTVFSLGSSGLIIFVALMSIIQKGDKKND